MTHDVVLFYPNGEIVSFTDVQGVEVDNASIFFWTDAKKTHNVSTNLPFVVHAKKKD